MRSYASVTSRYYLAQLVAQLNALKQYETPPFTYHVLCMDQYVFRLLGQLEYDFLFLHRLEDLESDELLEIKPGRTLSEYCWTVKPPFLAKLLTSQYDISGITYMDSDIFPFMDLQPIWDKLAEASIVLFPHNFPRAVAHMAEEVGPYNAGILTVKNDQTGRDAMDWLTLRVIEWCFHRSEDGKLGDQKYLVKFPELFGRVLAHDNHGVHVGPWNASEFEAHMKNGRVYIDGQPLMLYHFHEFKLNRDLSYTPASSAYNFSGNYMNYIYEPYSRRVKEALASIETRLPGFWDALHASM